MSGVWALLSALVLFVAAEGSDGAAKGAAVAEGATAGGGAATPSAGSRPSWWTPAAELSTLFDPDVADAGPPAAGAVPAPVGMSLVSVGEKHTAARVNVSGAGSVGHNDAGNAASDAVAEAAKRGVRGKQPLHQQSWFAWLRMTLSFAFVIKALCMVSNVAFQMSPMPLVKTWKESEDTGEADAAPFVSVAYTGSQWCFYGIFAYIVTAKSGFLVLVYSNIFGATFGCYYVYTFACICQSQMAQKQLTLYLRIAGTLAATQAAAMCVVPWDRALFFSGIVSSACSIASSVSLLVTVPLVLRTRNSKSMPLPLLLASMVSAFLWITCGTMLWDPWITLPNIISVCIITYALSLVYRFPPDGSAEVAADECDAREVVGSLLDGKGAPSSYGAVTLPSAETVMTGETGGTY